MPKDKKQYLPTANDAKRALRIREEVNTASILASSGCYAMKSTRWNIIMSLYSNNTFADLLCLKEHSLCRRVFSIDDGTYLHVYVHMRATMTQKAMSKLVKKYTHIDRGYVCAPTSMSPEKFNKEYYVDRLSEEVRVFRACDTPVEVEAERNGAHSIVVDETGLILVNGFLTTQH